MKYSLLPADHFPVVIVLPIIMVLALVLTFLTVSHGFTASERLECETWQAEASDIIGWYSTAWQKEQCKQFGISFTK